MGKGVAVEVDRDLFVSAVKSAESSGPLPNISALTNKVAEIYNSTADEKINAGIARLRITSWNLEIVTKAGKRGRPADPNKAPRVVKVPKEKAVVEEYVPNPDSALSAHGFVPRVDRVETEAALSAAVYGWTGKSVIAPVGRCPVKLTGTSETEVNTWIDAVMTAGMNNSVHYSPAALRYFSRQVYEYGTLEYQMVCDNIQNHLMGLVAAQRGDEEVVEEFAEEK